MSKTLADMAPEERQACVGMWCDIEGWNHLGIISLLRSGESIGFISPEISPSLRYSPFSHVTPRFDLPRAWNPDGTPVPANVSYDIQGHRETADEWVDFFGTRRCTLRRAKRDLAEAREEKPNIKWRLAMRHEPHLMAIPDDYQQPEEDDD